MQIVDEKKFNGKYLDLTRTKKQYPYVLLSTIWCCNVYLRSIVNDDDSNYYRFIIV